MRLIQPERKISRAAALGAICVPISVCLACVPTPHTTRGQQVLIDVDGDGDLDLAGKFARNRWLRVESGLPHPVSFVLDDPGFGEVTDFLAPSEKFPGGGVMSTPIILEADSASMEQFRSLRVGPAHFNLKFPAPSPEVVLAEALFEDVSAGVPTIYATFLLRGVANGPAQVSSALLSFESSVGEPKVTWTTTDPPAAQVNLFVDLNEGRLGESQIVTSSKNAQFVFTDDPQVGPRHLVSVSRDRVIMDELDVPTVAGLDHSFPYVVQCRDAEGEERVGCMMVIRGSLKDRNVGPLSVQRISSNGAGKWMSDLPPLSINVDSTSLVGYARVRPGMGMELVVTNFGPTESALHVIDQDLHLVQSVGLPPSTGWISFYDLDGDQLDDIVTVRQMGDNPQRFRNLGEGSFQPID